MNCKTGMKKLMKTMLMLVLVFALTLSAVYAAPQVSAAADSAIKLDYVYNEEAKTVTVVVKVKNPENAIAGGTVLLDTVGLTANTSGAAFENGASSALVKAEDGCACIQWVSTTPLAAQSEFVTVAKLPFAFGEGVDSLADVSIALCDDAAFATSCGIDSSANGYAFLIYNEGGESKALSVPANTLTVTPGTLPVAVTGVTLPDTTIELDEGETHELVATIEPSNAADKTVTWTTGNADVATVDANGKITAVGEGETTITVRTNDGSYTDTCNVKVAAVPVTIDHIDDLEIITVTGTAPELPEKVIAVMSNGKSQEVSVTWADVAADSYAAEGEFEVVCTVVGDTVTGKCKVTVTAPKNIKEIEAVSVETEEGTAPTLPAKVKVTYENGDKGEETVAWNKIASSQYADAGIFNVQGTVAGTTLKATCRVTVNEKPASSGKTIESIADSTVTTYIGKTPTLPETVKVKYNDASNADLAVTWGTIDAEKLKEEGTIVVEGTVEGTNIKAKCTITVTATPLIEKIEETKASTTVSKKPTLPEKVKVTYSDGSTKEVAVTWDTVAAEKYATVGTFTVNGKVEGTDLVAKCTVTVKKASSGSPSTGESIMGVLIALVLFVTSGIIAYFTWYKIRRPKLAYAETKSNWYDESFMRIEQQFRANRNNAARRANANRNAPRRNSGYRAPARRSAGSRPVQNRRYPNNNNRRYR